MVAGSRIERLSFWIMRPVSSQNSILRYTEIFYSGYFHINHHAFFFIHLQQLDILEWGIPISLSTSRNEFHFFISLHSREYWHTIREFLLSFQNFLFSIRLFLLSPVSYACCIFSDCVHHSRFTCLLSFLFQFLWFICGLFSGLGINIVATSLCTIQVSRIHLEYSHIVKYHLLFSQDTKVLFFQRKKLFIFHKLLTWYNPSYPSMSFHSSFLAIRFSR